MQKGGQGGLGREMSVPEDRNRGDHRVLGPGGTGPRQARADRRQERALRWRCCFTCVKWTLGVGVYGANTQEFIVTTMIRTQGRSTTPAAPSGSPPATPASTPNLWPPLTRPSHVESCVTQHAPECSSRWED